MLSFDKSKDSIPIAITKKNKVIYLNENYNNVPKQRNDIELSDYISQADFKKMINKKLTADEIKKLEKFLVKKEVPEEELLLDIYKDLDGEIEKKHNKEIILKDYDDGIEILPSKESERIYFAGPTGSGKSYNISQYIKNFKRLFPKKKIYLFSDQADDAQLDKYKPIRIMLNEELINDPVNVEELKNSLCVFDDIDSITDKKLKQQVELLRDSILKRGRHYSIYCLVSNHQINEYRLTKEILSACSKIFFYPKSGSGYSIKYLLKQYIGLNKDQINKILELPSRWVCLSKTAPIYVMCEHSIYLL
jgi:hypothetical protein